MLRVNRTRSQSRVLVEEEEQHYEGETRDYPLHLENDNRHPIVDDGADYSHKEGDLRKVLIDKKRTLPSKVLTSPLLARRSIPTRSLNLDSIQ